MIASNPEYHNLLVQKILFLEFYVFVVRGNIVYVKKTVWSCTGINPGYYDTLTRYYAYL